DLIKGSFVPDSVLQQMRQLSRQFRRLTKSKVRLEQQIDNQLQRCNIRLSNYVSNHMNSLNQGINFAEKRLFACCILHPIITF
ncbi:MAG: hypothetical protein KBG17_07600, partial [Paludibacteraceae bacterium]|nr:hypothetical protein [Paludibacteraceae bacterium]